MSAAPAPRRLTLTAHQSPYLPWLGLFAKIADADLYCHFDGVPLEDSGFENRNRILSPAGPQWLTVPVKRGRDVLLRDVEIANEHAWQRKHWRSIEQAYQSAPHWKLYAPGLRAFYERRFDRLSDLNLAMLAWFMEQLGISTPVVLASAYAFEGFKSGLVLDMCRKLGATTYIFGAQGRDYADVAAFERAGITVEFQDYQHPEYPQFRGGEFVSHLAALDLLMNVGPENGEVLR